MLQEHNIVLVLDLNPELFRVIHLSYLMFCFVFCHVKISLGREGSGTSPIEMAEIVMGYLENKGYLQA